VRQGDFGFSIWDFGFLARDGIFPALIMKIVPRSLAALALVVSLSSCSLIKMPLNLLGRTVNSLLGPVGGVGGAARLAPLLLDAKDGQQGPVRGQKYELKGREMAPSQRLVPVQEMVKATSATTSSEG
jgi:hypothetical protein